MSVNQQLVILAMQKQEVWRNTFMNSYKLDYSQKLTLTLPPQHIGSDKIEEMTLVPSDDYRLSKNKMELLENFKQAISYHSPCEDNSPQEEPKMIKSTLQVSLPCLQIKEQSQQSSSEIKTNQKSLPNNRQIQKIVQRNEEQQKIKQATGKSYIFEERSKLDKTLSQPDRLKPQLQMIKCNSQEIERQINQFNRLLKALCKGIAVYKYCFFRNKKQKVGLYFSQNFQFMALYNFDKNVFTNYSMRQFISVTYGIKSNRFKEYVEKGWQINQQYCFSLIFKDRSFDFYLQDLQEIAMLKSYFKLLANVY